MVIGCSEANLTNHREWRTGRWNKNP